MGYDEGGCRINDVFNFTLHKWYTNHLCWTLTIVLTLSCCCCCIYLLIRHILQNFLWNILWVNFFLFTLISCCKTLAMHIESLSKLLLYLLYYKKYIWIYYFLYIHIHIHIYSLQWNWNMLSYNHDYVFTLIHGLLTTSLTD